MFSISVDSTGPTSLTWRTIDSLVAPITRWLTVLSRVRRSSIFIRSARCPLSVAMAGVRSSMARESTGASAASALPSRSIPSRTRSMSSRWALSPVTSVFSRVSSCWTSPARPSSATLSCLMIVEMSANGPPVTVADRATSRSLTSGAVAVEERGSRSPLRSIAASVAAWGGVSSTNASPMGAVVRTSARVPFGTGVSCRSFSVTRAT